MQVWDQMFDFTGSPLEWFVFIGVIITILILHKFRPKDNPNWRDPAYLKNNCSIVELRYLAYTGNEIAEEILDEPKKWSSSL